jgi:NTP pyrophosphohydrolases including oxidative damage repair enzymes
MESWIKRRTAFVGSFFSVVTGTVSTPKGGPAKRDIVEHRGGVAIIPVYKDSVLLIRQFRISVGCEMLELPAGRLESLDELPARRAALELEEEVGYVAERLELVAEYYSSPGFTNERMDIYMASGLTRSARNGDWDEDIRVCPVKLTDIESMLREGRIKDSKTIIGLFFCLQRLGLPKGEGQV